MYIGLGTVVLVVVVVMLFMMLRGRRVVWALSSVNGWPRLDHPGWPG
jgi:hypothetical protein